MKQENENTAKERTPSDTLISCLEDFGEDEPKKVIVLYTTKGGDLCWSVSGPDTYTETVGILECAKTVILKKFLATGKLASEE
jgi:hypothetical protein